MLSMGYVAAIREMIRVRQIFCHVQKLFYPILAAFGVPGKHQRYVMCSVIYFILDQFLLIMRYSTKTKTHDYFSVSQAIIASTFCYLIFNIIRSCSNRCSVCILNVIICCCDSDVYLFETCVAVFTGL